MHRVLSVLTALKLTLPMIIVQLPVMHLIVGVHGNHLVYIMHAKNIFIYHYIDGKDCSELFGVLDNSWAISYAIAMFIR